MQWLVGGSGGYGCDGGLRGFVQAWCMTSSHVKVERMDTSVCSGRGGLEGKNIQTVYLDVSRNPMNL